MEEKVKSESHNYFDKVEVGHYRPLPLYGPQKKEITGIRTRKSDLFKHCIS